MLDCLLSWQIKKHPQTIAFSSPSSLVKMLIRCRVGLQERVLQVPSYIVLHAPVSLVGLQQGLHFVHLLKVLMSPAGARAYTCS